MSYIRILPKEIYEEILFNLEPKELLQTCQTAKYAYYICNNNTFMEQYLTKWYSHILISCHFGYKTWKEVKDEKGPSYWSNLLKNIDQLFYTFDVYIVNENKKEARIQVYMLIDDTINDFITRIIRIFSKTKYKNCNIFNIMIKTINFDKIIYNVSTSKVKSTIGRSYLARKVTSNMKYKDINVFIPGYNAYKNIYENLLVYNDISIVIV
jgi:hypothetical protein